MTTNNTDVIRIEIRVNGGRLGEVGPFAVVTDQAGSKPKVLSRIAQRTEALARPRTFGNDKYVALSSKIRLICILSVSVMLSRLLRNLDIESGNQEKRKSRTHRETDKASKLSW